MRSRRYSVKLQHLGIIQRYTVYADRSVELEAVCGDEEARRYPEDFQTREKAAGCIRMAREYGHTVEKEWL